MQEGATRKTTPNSPKMTPTSRSNGGGTLYLVLTQVASRGFTFLGNQFLLQYLSPSLLGLAVQLELLSVTVLYFARESLRVALQRQPAQTTMLKKDASLYSQQAVNLAYLVIAIGLGSAFVFGYGYIQKASVEIVKSSNFRLAFQLYAAATLVELASEICFVLIQGRAMYKARARAETAAAMARCSGACITALIRYRRHSPASVLPFAVGQVCYAITLFAVYLSATMPLMNAENFSFLPQVISTTGTSEYLLGMFYRPVLSLTVTFYAQSIFKLLLTQGDSLILSFLTDLQSQGAFALASNYGGLLSRLVFQPVEESSRNILGRLLAGGTAAQPCQQSSSSSSSSGSDRKSPTPNSTSFSTRSQLHRAINHLSTTLHIYTVFALPMLALTPPIIPALTNLCLSPQWRTPETTALLSAYLHYLPFLAVNGVLDAFVTSVATPAQLRDQSLLMAAITAIYGLVAWVLMGTSRRADNLRGLFGLSAGPMGSPGLVYANMANMALRIAYSVWFISRWIRLRVEKPSSALTLLWANSMPRLSCVIMAVAVGFGLRATVHPDLTSIEKRFVGIKGLSVEDVGHTLGGALILAFTIILSERHFLVAVALPLVPQRLAAYLKPFAQSRPGLKQE